MGVICSADSAQLLPRSGYQAANHWHIMRARKFEATPKHVARMKPTRSSKATGNPFAVKKTTKKARKRSKQALKKCNKESLDKEFTSLPSNSLEPFLRHPGVALSDRGGHKEAGELKRLIPCECSVQVSIAELTEQTRRTDLCASARSE